MLSHISANTLIWWAFMGPILAATGAGFLVNHIATVRGRKTGGN